MTTECGKTVYWWDGEYEGGCRLEAGHRPEDVHYDGLSWYNDDNEEIANPTPELRWHYGPTDADPEPGKMWHYDCGGEVWYFDGGPICTKCKQQGPEGQA